MYTLQPKDDFLLRFEQSVKECWDKPALDDFRVSSLTYGELAARIETNVLMWRAAGIKPGDKISINAKSSSAWAEIFFSTQVAGVVTVQIFPGYTPSDTASLVNHSEARILYTEKSIFEKMDFDSMPDVIGVIECRSQQLLAARGNFAEVFNSREELFAKAHPAGFTPADIHYRGRDMDQTVSIMYTSGSTGNPKGVVLTCRNLSANVYLIPHNFPYRTGDNYVSVLPYAHIFGMTYDMVTPLSLGMHLVVLCVPPVPAYLKPALREFRPHVFFAVPLILTKLLEDTVGEFIHSKSGEAKLANYKEHPDFCEALATIMMKALGGNIEVFVTGGAAIPEQFEKLFVEQLQLPFVTGYGMTEAGPTICLGHLPGYKLKSCGEYIDECVDLKIDSSDPHNLPGEILIKGEVVFKEYYKNPNATRAAFTEDGWFHTGDIGIVDGDKTVFIMGRSKSMILTSNGQNIYPEEIEVVLNQMPYVVESIVVNRNDHLVALIVPNQDQIADMDADALHNVMQHAVDNTNRQIPAYSQIASYELQMQPFAKTPKGSIRRFMYK